MDTSRPPEFAEDLILHTCMRTPALKNLPRLKIESLNPSNLMAQFQRTDFHVKSVHASSVDLVGSLSKDGSTVTIQLPGSFTSFLLFE